ncbi:MAG: mitochondrial fission ELM1 family protein [Deltaproteobacteria bacterium]|nr:mitochondrial fission ELM1 family protein [Deltaproteobacteria bacterium]
MRHDSDAAPPRVWMLLGDKAGDNEQLRILGRALDWSVEEKALRFTRLVRVPNVLLGATRASLSAPTPYLGPPWPAVVLASGRRAAPIAFWIKRRSGGRTRLVHLGRPRAPLAWFDLVVTSPQYGLPGAPNVLRVDLPLNEVAPERLRSEAAVWRPRVAALPGPYLALLVGGATKSLCFDAAAAAELGSAVSAVAARAGMSVLATTSRRTPGAAADALAKHLRVPHVLHRWRPDAPRNPYAGFLGLADRIVVTGDSASMAAEACRTGKPVAIAPVRQLDLAGWLARGVRGTCLEKRLRAIGLCNGQPDMQSFVRRLVAVGYATLLGAPPAAVAPAPTDLGAVTARVRHLVLRGP